MAVKTDREYRAIIDFEASENEDNGMIVTGYAATFDRYLLMTIDGIDYFEQIERHAFDNADFSDVIMQYDHEGRVLARTSNSTLALTVDDHGLAITANLSTSEASRSLYNDIKSGLVTQMSFGFKCRSDFFDTATNTRNITSIAKVYDVSAVSIPANPGTEIATRAYLDGVIKEAEAERLREAEKETRRKKLALRLKLMED